MAKGKKVVDYLVFVDTNIYLDFYRNNNDASLKLLKHLVKIKEKIISSYQVEMEFKKNRQKVLVESLQKLKEIDLIQMPSFLVETKKSKAIKRKVREINDQIKVVRKRLIEMLKRPLYTDPVFQDCQKIFDGKNDIVLSRENKFRHVIKRRAYRRFILGYPPRKDTDIAIGDALNWEWIINCSEKTRKDVIIVSRDLDYGARVKDETFLNDWLEHEFRDRLSLQRKIVYVSSLSKAFSLLNVPISKAEIESEKKFVDFKNEGSSNATAFMEAVTQALIGIQKDPSKISDLNINVSD